MTSGWKNLAQLKMLTLGIKSYVFEILISKRGPPTSLDLSQKFFNVPI